MQISADGGWVYVYRSREIQGKIWLQELRSGKRHLWKELRGADPSIEVRNVFVTPGGEAYTYGTLRTISTCYVVEGPR